MAEPATWLVLLPELPVGAAASGVLAWAQVVEDGDPAGVLVAWRTRRKPLREALRCADAVVDPAGGAWAVSWVVIASRERRPLFDDPAVVEATRAVRRHPGRSALVSTLVADPMHWAGALTGAAPDVVSLRPAWWGEDPYARLAPARRLHVGPGLFRGWTLPGGPGVQRYSGAPWPAEQPADAGAPRTVGVAADAAA